MKIAILVSKYTLKRINRNICFQKYHEKYPIASVYLKYVFFNIKNGNFGKKIKTKSDHNTRVGVEYS